MMIFYSEGKLIMRKLALVATGKACRVGQYVFVDALILAISPKVTKIESPRTRTSPSLLPAHTNAHMHIHTPAMKSSLSAYTDQLSPFRTRQIAHISRPERNVVER